MELKDKAAEWLAFAGRSIVGYRDALLNLHDGELYHADRPSAPRDDRDAKPFPGIRIPLLWGTF